MEEISLENYFKMALTEYLVICMGCRPYAFGKTNGESLEIYLDKIKTEYNINYEE